MHARSQAQTHSQMCMRFLFSGLTDANQSRWRGKEGGIEKARLRQAGGGRKVKKREILSSSEETKRGWWSTLTKRCRERERESHAGSSAQIQRYHVHGQLDEWFLLPLLKHAHTHRHKCEQTWEIEGRTTALCLRACVCTSYVCLHILNGENLCFQSAVL